MKPWLFDILACPIDKNFPLKLYIFSYETPAKVFESLLAILINRDINEIEYENIINVSYEGEKIKIQDNLVLEETELVPYLKLIKKSLEELENVYDLSTIANSKQLLNQIRTDIKGVIHNCIKDASKEVLKEIYPELIVINNYKFEIEIKTGILFCSECKRWFPIIDTIPQLLPDEYRDEKIELEFLKTNKNLLDDEFFHQELKPFNLEI
ncbi:MAG: hypothetical protein EU517_01480 [Promethearchaeota archaeon]|nr:MAG: hypothetical protein EU517_01480 [Candidatus Lokiarchaeota archaeon]